MTLANERALFEACLALPASERAAWLDAHCPDAALRARMERLLRAHQEAEAGHGFPSAVPATQLAERRIGPYRVFERIGEGAMGEVYLAEQTAPVVRRVALKIIKPGMDTREVIARFEIERQTLAIMSHPAIAQIFDAGATETGRPYFAMEYVPGIPLTEYCATHQLDLRRRLTLFLEICDGVQHAHHKGIIHRDLKPTNLLVAERHHQPHPVVKRRVNDLVVREPARRIGQGDVADFPAPAFHERDHDRVGLQRPEVVADWSGGQRPQLVQHERAGA